MISRNKIGEIFDWHSPHNDQCPQNTCDIRQDCTCEQPVRRERKCDWINRAYVKKMLLSEANDRQNLRIFTCVSKKTLDEIASMVKNEVISRAINPPRKGKTL